MIIGSLPTSKHFYNLVNDKRYHIVASTNLTNKTKKKIRKIVVDVGIGPPSLNNYADVNSHPALHLKLWSTTTAAHECLVTLLMKHGNKAPSPLPPYAYIGTHN